MGGLCTRAAWVGAALAITITAAPRAALADPVGDAKDLFTRGRQLRARGDCAEAIPLFRQASELYPAGLGSLRNLAECDEAVQKFSSAREAWLTLAHAVHSLSDPKYQGWDADAEQAATRLQAKASALIVDLSVVGAGGDAKPAEGVQVTLDGAPLEASLLGQPLERDAGHYTLRVTGEKLVEPVEREVDLAPGDAEHVELRATMKTDVLPPPIVAAMPPPSPVTPPPSRPSDAGRQARRSVGWVALGMGAAGAIGAGVSFAIREVASTSLQHTCPDYRTGCNESLESSLAPTVNAGHIASTLVTVCGVVGVVGLAGGIVLLATTPSRPVEASLAVTPGGVSLGGRFE